MAGTSGDWHWTELRVDREFDPILRTKTPPREVDEILAEIESWAGLPARPSRPAPPKVAPLPPLPKPPPPEAWPAPWSGQPQEPPSPRPPGWWARLCAWLNREAR